MTVWRKKVPLPKRLWRWVRYPGIRFHLWTYACDDPDHGWCCNQKIEHPGKGWERTDY